MNAQVSVIEPEALEYLPAKTLLRLVEQSQKVKKHTALFQTTLRAHPELFRILEELDIEVAFCLRSGDIDLSFTGDGQRLIAVWKELRLAGWKPNAHPKKGDTSFHTHWPKEGFATFWMSFSSSVCRRVQVGTKMVEQPIYETQCAELPLIEAETPATAVVEVDSEIPF